MVGTRMPAVKNDLFILTRYHVPYAGTQVRKGQPVKFPNLASVHFW